MQPKYLFRIVTLLAMLFSVFGTSSQVLAKEAPVNQLNAQVINRSTAIWDAVYPGSVDALRYERWSFELTEANNFSVTATPTGGDLVPLVILMDANGVEISQASGTLNSNQPTGSYFVQIQPGSGSGTYNLTLRKVQQTVEPSVSTVVTPASFNIGESAVATVNLNNIPTEGYTSAEFTCTYNESVVEVSDITEAGLFGTDAVMIINGPQSGSFIVALAGSNGQKATTSGAAITFTLTGLQAGESSVECTARVSSGDATLTQISSSPAAVTVTIPQGTLAGQVIASKPVTVNLYNADSSLAGTVVVNQDGTFSLTAPAGTYTVTATASGFLSAQGSPVITGGNTTTLQSINLVAGDIDGNDVIDQYDALTIGMSYNTATPAAADLNNDGTINVLDLEILAGNYRQSGALAWQ